MLERLYNKAEFAVDTTLKLTTARDKLDNRKCQQPQKHIARFKTRTPQTSTILDMSAGTTGWARNARSSLESISMVET